MTVSVTGHTVVFITACYFGPSGVVLNTQHIPLLKSEKLLSSEKQPSWGVHISLLGIVDLWSPMTYTASLSVWTAQSSLCLSHTGLLATTAPRPWHIFYPCVSDLPNRIPSLHLQGGGRGGFFSKYYFSVVSSLDTLSFCPCALALFLAFFFSPP